MRLQPEQGQIEMYGGDRDAGLSGQPTSASMRGALRLLAQRRVYQLGHALLTYRAWSPGLEFIVKSDDSMFPIKRPLITALSRSLTA
jgi:hypothetical protein